MDKYDALKLENQCKNGEKKFSPFLLVDSKVYSDKNFLFAIPYGTHPFGGFFHIRKALRISYRDACVSSAATVFCRATCRSQYAL